MGETTRAEATDHANTWAARADQLATDYDDARERGPVYAEESARVKSWAVLRDQARDMALMWAAIAALPAANQEADHA